MGKHQTITVLILGLLVSSCASDGTLAGKSKPLDKETTRLALCEGAQKVDLAWHVISAASTVIPADASAVEATFITTVGFKAGLPDAAGPGTICAKEYSGDLDVAINTAILATINISKLIQAWSTK